MDDILPTIDAALKRKGLTDAAASKLAVGHPALIKNLRLPKRGEKRYNLPSLKRLAAVLDLEFYFGPKRNIEPPPTAPAEVHIGGDEFSLIARYDVNVSAGPGLVPISEEIDGRLAFSKQWLARHRINPNRAGLVRVLGESMAPTVPDRALVLVNQAENSVDREGIYAYSRNGDAFVKRLVPVGRGPDGRPVSLVIISDSGDPAAEVVVAERLNELRIVGRVRSVMVDL